MSKIFCIILICLPLQAFAQAPTGQLTPFYFEPIKFRSPHSSAYGMFAKSLAPAGDVNGDGYPDVAFGAPNINLDPNQGPLDTEVVIFLGPAFNDSLRLLHPRGQIFTYFGISVCSLGDVEGNGKSAIIVGAPSSGGGLVGGEAFVYTRPGTTEGILSLQSPNPQAGNDFGSALACVGDVNGDGKPDVLVGAPGQDNDNRINDGQAVLLYGPDFKTESVTLLPTLSGNNLFFASSVALAGDVDNDGEQDLIVGAPESTPGQLARAGAAVVYFGPDYTRSILLQAPADYAEADAEFGTSLAGPGDVNGDGYADVLVSAPYKDGPAGMNIGQAYLFYGPDLVNFSLVDDPVPTPFAVFGFSVSSLGDLDQDQKPDLYLSAPGRNTALIFKGQTQNLLWSYTLTEGANFWGEAISGAGDLNDDSAPDLLVGMRRACLPNPNPALKMPSFVQPQAEVCDNPDDFPEVGLGKILFSSFPKISGNNVSRTSALLVNNFLPEGSTLAIVSPGSLEILGQAQDGGSDDADGLANGAVTVHLTQPVGPGTPLQASNLSTGQLGRIYWAKTVAAPVLSVLLCAALLGWFRIKKKPERPFL